MAAMFKPEDPSAPALAKAPSRARADDRRGALSDRDDGAQPWPPDDAAGRVPVSGAGVGARPNLSGVSVLLTALKPCPCKVAPDAVAACTQTMIEGCPPSRR